MASGRKLGEMIGIREEQVENACSSALKAHKSPGQPYILEKTRGSDTVLFIFPGSWSLADWVAQKPFGDTTINQGPSPQFPSLRSIGNDEAAKVNEAFLRRFESKILGSSDFQQEVQRAIADKKQIVFTGHSMGGSMAILATIWFLEKFKLEKTVSPRCLTFGCPLTGNHIFSHALRREEWGLRREKWSDFFVHFVMRYDIVPRVLLAPIPSIEQQFQSILHFFSKKSVNLAQESIETPEEASDFYTTVMRNASSVASHSACILMGNKNLLLETVANFIALSPYRPFGTYIFCTGNGKLVVLRNPDAVLQLLFHSSLLNSATDLEQIARVSLHQHFGYEKELKESFGMQDVVDLNQLEKLPLSPVVTGGDSVTINSALNDLGLSTRARLCIRAAGEFENQKQANKDSIEKKREEISKSIEKIEGYRSKCEVRNEGYYDAFKLQENHPDFDANVERIKLAGIWDEIIDMLKRYELPDGFEGDSGWVELGTRFRRLVEPLDIANYYRHGKNEDTGPYIKRARPKRYRYTQRWHEHAQKMPAESSGESHFWAEVEELRSRTTSTEGFEGVRERVSKLETNIQNWINSGELGGDALLEESTLMKWWKTLPDYHKDQSPISRLICAIDASLDRFEC